MSAYDELIIRRRAERAQEQAQADSDFQPSATSAVRFKAWAIIGIGIVVCFSQFWKIGLAFIIMGLLWLMFSPAMEQAEHYANAEQKRQQADGSGAGCMANVWAVFVGAALLTVGGLVAMAIGVSLLGGQ